LRSLMRPRRLAVVESCLIGLAAGLAAVAVKQGVGLLGGLRLNLAIQYPAWLALPLFGLAGGLIAGLLVEHVCPETAGSGIPQVKALLKGAPVKFSLRLVWVKLLGGVSALGSGLLLGREGPTVQVGAAFAAQFERWLPTSPTHRRQLIAAGAGAGLAAAFNAPIAGVLFVAEELLKDLSGFTLGTAVLASLVASAVSEWLGGSALGIDFRQELPASSFSLEEIPFYVLLGASAGLFGALFNAGILSSLTVNFRRSGLPLMWRVALAGLLSGLLVSCLPPLFYDNAGLRHLLVSGEPNWQVAALAFCLQFVLTVIAYGAGAPGGLFAPTLMLGASLGYLTGLLAASILSTSMPHAFALAGMGAFFSGAIRAPMTAVVIVFEMTHQFALVLPLMIVCIVAWLVGEKVSPGPLYDRLVEWSSLAPAPAEVPGRLPTASDVMRPVKHTLAASSTVKEAAAAFRDLRMHECVVVEEQKFVGILSDTELLASCQEQLSDRTLVSELVAPNPVTVQSSTPLSEITALMQAKDATLLPVIQDGVLIGTISAADLVCFQVNGVETGAQETSEPPQ
ncbi:MAG TPA: chloride channel protein, partial [Candidatus Obscuribacterales bacterium]